MSVKKKENNKDVPSKKDNIFEEEVRNEAPDFEDKSGDVTEVELDDKSVAEQALPMSVVKQMMEAMMDKMRGEFDSKLRMKESQAKIDDNKEYVDDLVDDWMDSPAIFFAFSSSFSIHGDRKKGALTTPPNGAIKFKNIIRSKKRSSRGTQIICVSTVKVQSRKEAEYIRTHSQFGIKFFENMTDAIIADTTWAQKLIEANHSVQGLSDQQLIARCQMEGIPVTQTPEDMRRELVEIIAKKNTAKQDEIRISRLKKSVLTEGEDGVRRFTEEKKINI